MATVHLQAVRFIDPRDPRFHAPLPLRLDDVDLLPADEWRRTDLPGREFPLAFSTQRQGATFLRCQLTIELRGDQPVTITAQAANMGPSAVLGKLNAVPIQVRPGTETYVVDLTGEPLQGPTTAVLTVQLQWRLRLPDGTTDQVVSSLQVFLLPGVPQDPWSVKAGVSIGTPWVKALKHACKWAEGAATPLAAADRITKRLHELGNEPHPKHPVESFLRYAESAHFTDNAAPVFRFDRSERYQGTFYLGRFLRLLDGEQDLAGVLNCADCASIVSTFVNLLGGGLDQARVSEGGFDSHPVRLIGRDNPWKSEDFIYHEVAWAGDLGSEGTIWDACLEVDGDKDPSRTPRKARLPLAMRFGDADDEDGYLFRLAPLVRARVMQPPIAYRERRPLLLDPRRPLPPLNNEGFLLPRGPQAPWIWPKPSRVVQPAALLHQLDTAKDTWRFGSWEHVREIPWAEVHEARCLPIYGKHGRQGRRCLRLFFFPDSIVAQDVLWQMLNELALRTSAEPLAGTLGDLAFGDLERYVLFVRGNVIVDLCHLGCGEEGLQDLAGEVDRVIIDCATEPPCPDTA